MLGDIVGYAIIKGIAPSCMAIHPEEFLGKCVRVLEFNKEGDALALNSMATEMAMIDACDIHRKFKCEEFGEYLLPPGLTLIHKAAYAMKLMERKGGYNRLLKEMVIMASLHKGEYNDDFLFQKQ